MKLKLIGMEVNLETQQEFDMTFKTDEIPIEKLDKWKRSLGKWITVDL